MTTVNPSAREAVGEYKWGFHDEVQPLFIAEKGLNEEMIRGMSRMKGEPEWMLEQRLDAYRTFLTLHDPSWAGSPEVLGAIGPTVAPQGSFNTEVGVPMTVCRAQPTTEFLILEMGMRGLGHIHYLCQVAQPDIGNALAGLRRQHRGQQRRPADIEGDAHRRRDLAGRGGVGHVQPVGQDLLAALFGCGAALDRGQNRFTVVMSMPSMRINLVEASRVGECRSPSLYRCATPGVSL